MKVSLNHHTIVLLVGPTGAGKSTFADALLAKLWAQGSNGIIVSSDAIRRMLLQDDSIHGHDPRMLEVSEQAFKHLFNNVEAAATYPINIPFIIVDTRGFDPVFRKQIADIAKKNAYKLACVSFEFKTAISYLEYLTDEEAKVASPDVKRFRRDVLPELRSRDFDQLIRVKGKVTTSDIELILPDNEMYSKCMVYNHDKKAVVVIGDSHECVDQLETLISNVATEVPGEKIYVHVGDYLDKGGNTGRMLSFMLGRLNAGDLIVPGNHESYLYRRLKGEITPAPIEIEEKYFTALKDLQENPAYRTAFFHLHESSLPFVRIETPGQRTVYVTHAPCELKYLGKLSPESARAQRNLYVKDREADIRSQMSFIYDQARGSNALHVFGHIAHNSQNLVYRNNKVFLDTGCVHGGKLTAFIQTGDRYDFLAVRGPRIEEQVKELPTNMTQLDVVEKGFNIRDYDLSVEDTKFLNGAMRNGIKYISGTMAPAPSWDGQLEPLSAGLDYFLSRGVTQVVLEPKYMGSRCQFYLYKDKPEESFAVSRNGYRIRHVERLEEELKRWHDKVYDWYDGCWTEIILDGELLPWMALGEGLIDHQFHSYEELVANELTTLNLDESFAELDVAQNYDAEGRLKDWNVFSETLGLYAKKEDLEFRAFNILSCDGRIVNGTPEDMFQACSSDEYLVVDLEDEASRAKAKGFFDHLTVGKGMEGVVIKPYLNQSHVFDLPKGVPEYMKVRNENYLTLVYGYDYKRRYDRLVYQKNISGKVAVSIRESKIAREMLTANDDDRFKCMVKMIAELKKEHTLDPRL